MMDEQLIEAINRATRAENELTREKCLGAVEDVRSALAAYKAENQRDHQQVKQRLGLLEKKIQIPKRLALGVLAASGATGSSLAILYESLFT